MEGMRRPYGALRSGLSAIFDGCAGTVCRMGARRSSAPVLDREQRRSAHLVARDLRKAYDGAPRRRRRLADRRRRRAARDHRRQRRRQEHPAAGLLAGTLTPDGGTVACTTGRTLGEQELDARARGDRRDAARRDARPLARRVRRARRGRRGAGLPRMETRSATPRPWPPPRSSTRGMRAAGCSTASTRSTPPSPSRRRCAGSPPASATGCGSPARCTTPRGAILLDEPSNHLDDRALDSASPNGSATTAGSPSSSPTTAGCSTPSRPRCSTWTRPPTAAARFFSGSFQEFRRERARRMRRWRDRYAASLEAQERLE